MNDSGNILTDLLPSNVLANISLHSLTQKKYIYIYISLHFKIYLFFIKLLFLL